ncbi:M23 family metallopeptidase [Metabacillus endolithicus]|uniref:M23 family metallopeptidase n=1 Tax=Metabacillus endolithicus TaxID=1535204 RepID=A0ABW5C438_9BACI
MPCTWVGWQDPTCSGNGKGNISESNKKSISYISRMGGYGTDGNNDGVADMWNIWDAVFSSAHLLKDNGFLEDKRKAIYSYNHSNAYVDEVVHYAELFASNTGGTPEVTKGKFMRPSLGPITSPFGPRWGKLHAGIDIGSNASTDPIVASADGVVVRSYTSSSYGECIMIKHNIEGETYTTVYAHMVTGSRRVQMGQTVQKGQVIGIKGTTGSSTGVHLHFEIRKGDWSTNQSNAIDPIGSGLLQLD